MGTHALLSNIINNCAHYRLLLKNRILIVFQQPNLSIKSEAKSKAEELNIPEAPKKPLTSYFRYLSECRPLLKKQHPNWSVVEITKKCAQDWKEMDPMVRHKYEDAYHKELEMYNEKHQTFTALLTPEQLETLTKIKHDKQEDKKKRTLKKLQRESDKPKRPVSNFGFFVKEKFGLPENKEKKFVDILKTYKEEWSRLTDAQKEKYNNLHKQDKLRYNTEMEKWESKMIKAGKGDIVRKDSQILTAKTTKVNRHKKLGQDKAK
ncbi:hypothetical protein FQR65_LT01778 [Abscondita terminalis]|nr:hypothetical protein FQR65_LT01778 [Abscondita terminalis]